MNVAVIGTGYVGLVSGACFADFGHQVTCIDLNVSRIDSLRRGEVPFFKPNTSDVRESPALYICRALVEVGASVSAYDPIAQPEAAHALHGVNADYAKDAHRGSPTRSSSSRSGMSSGISTSNGCAASSGGPRSSICGTCSTRRTYARGASTTTAPVAGPVSR